MIATATPDDYRRALPALLADPGVDAVVAMFIPLSVTSTAEVARAIAETSRTSAKPVLATFFGAPRCRQRASADTLLHVSGIPCSGARPRRRLRQLAIGAGRVCSGLRRHRLG